MMGTNSTFRSLNTFLTIALTCASLSILWGCAEDPISVDSSNESVVFSEVLAPRGVHKPDVTTIVGAVEDIDYVATRLRVDSHWFFADNETEIEVSDCNPCLFADIAQGDPARIVFNHTTDANGNYYAREIEVEHEDAEEPEEPDNEPVETTGVVDVVDGERLLVAGVWFWVDETTEINIDDECADDAVMLGDSVKMEHAPIPVEGLGYYAYKVEIARDCAEEGEEEGDE